MRQASSNDGRERIFVGFAANEMGSDALRYPNERNHNPSLAHHLNSQMALTEMPTCISLSQTNYSEQELSLLTDGRLNEGTIPNVCSITSIVAPFIGEPLPE